MKTTPWLAVALVAVLSQAATADQPPSSPVKGAKVVKLCDNKTTVQVAADTPKTPEEGKKIADALMAHPYRRRLRGFRNAPSSIEAMRG